jgi:threonine dehydratase
MKQEGLLPSPESVLEAEGRIRAHIPPTPLWHSPALSDLLAADVWIKGEFASVLSSFKLRGALNHLLADPIAKSACTSSTGNHGQAVAYAARLLGRDADIFLPHGCPETKRAAIASFGARLHVGGADLDDAKEAAKTFAASRDVSFVDDGESRHVIAGAGTLGLEIGRSLPKTEFVFAPTGSACLASGTAIGLLAAQSRARVIAVQSAQTPCMVRSFHARRAIEHPVTTICDCLNQRIPPALALATMLAYVSDALEVDDEDCLSAMHTALARAHVLIEPGTAAALAGAWARRDAIKDATVVLIFSGANVDVSMVKRALESPLLGAQRDSGNQSSP